MSTWLRFFDCCLEVEVPMLVYDFVPGGTLFDLIHVPQGKEAHLFMGQPKNF